MLSIQNNGPEITATNYWKSPYAVNGAVFLSINAKCFRVLLPAALEQSLADMRTAREVVVSRGPWHEHGRADAIELLFEDCGPNPFVMLFGKDQIDNFPLDRDHGRLDLTCSVWTIGPVKAMELPAKYRIVKKLPCAKAWGEK
jgi:hypothetical protein